MAQSRSWLVTYDIADSKRLRQVHKLMRGYGEWSQYSVVLCLLDPMSHAEMIADLDVLIHHGSDHVLLFDIGNPNALLSKVTSLGKPWLPPTGRDIVL